MEDIYELERIEDFLVKNKVTCVKYNSNLLPERPLQSYDAFLQLSPDKQTLRIVKKLVIHNYELQAKKEAENEALLHFK